MDVLRTSYDALKGPALRDAFVLLAGMWPAAEEFRDDAMVVRNLAATVHHDAQNPTMQAKQTLAELTCRSLVKQTRVPLEDSLQELLERSTFRVTIHDLLSDLEVELADGDRAGVDLHDRRFCCWVGRDQLPPTPTNATRWEHPVVGPSNMSDLPSLFFGTKLKLRSLVIYSCSGVMMPPLYPGLASCGLLMVHHCTDVVWTSDAFAGLVNLRVLDLFSDPYALGQDPLADARWEAPQKTLANRRGPGLASRVVVYGCLSGGEEETSSAEASKDGGSQEDGERDSNSTGGFPGLPAEVGSVGHLRMAWQDMRRL